MKANEAISIGVGLLFALGFLHYGNGGEATVAFLGAYLFVWGIFRYIEGEEDESESSCD